MSTLQISLVLLGIIVVLAVIAYNTWYNSTHAPRKARQAEIEAAADPAQRKEPALDAHASAAAPTEGAEPRLDGTAFAGQSAHSAPVPDAVAAEATGAPQSAHPAAPAPAQAQAQVHANGAAHAPSHGQELDSLVFSIVPIELDKPVSGDAALAALPPTRRVGNKQFVIQGLNLQNQIWESPRLGARYGQFQAGIQLANRQGALNEIEFSEFIVKSQEFADAVAGAPDFPDMLHEVARAREIDGFAAQNDAVLSFMLVARRATWSPGYVRQCAAEYGFKPSVTPGRLVVPASNPLAPPVLVLNYDPQAALADDLDHAPIHEIVLTLDVPNVDRSENAFARLRAALEGLAATMEGSLADPQGRSLPAMVMEPIAGDIDRLYDSLEARGIAAGSPAALKLFS
ncbi:cell division protein FtsZ [Corticibacter populi]|uniref:Cell division protein FtsZ n=1 Tax=Corticibacter populi TaxID=1550736 RepID=A0A3M6R000_9BURK|nr:cell division protein FtsZ [Corticibacter populi]RMX08594.1 cell division protein FtsZ [Corticibacter populi]RZS35919.1 hypothetical protein EV687_1001 [Corticibacter populi]